MVRTCRGSESWKLSGRVTTGSSTRDTICAAPHHANPHNVARTIQRSAAAVRDAAERRCASLCQHCALGVRHCCAGVGTEART